MYVFRRTHERTEKARKETKNMNKRKRIYISGKISGTSKKQCHSKFMDAHHMLSDKGYTVINPMYLDFYDLEYEKYMTIDFILLETCDAIYMLHDWKDSPGAKREKAYAEWLGLEVIYQEEE